MFLIKRIPLAICAVVAALLCMAAEKAGAQATVVRGVVRDAETKQPLEFVNVFFPGTPTGTTTDAAGRFELRSEDGQRKIEVTHVSYKSLTLDIQPGETQNLTVKLQAEGRALNEVVVKPKKVKYRNKDNPAVELIRQVISHRDENRATSNEYLEYESYEKVELSLTNTPDKLRKNRVFRSFKYMVNNIDTTSVPNKALMPLYMQEELADNYFRKRGEKRKKVIKAQKQVNFGQYLDNAGVNTYIKHLYQDVDIYNSNITVVTNQFLSPISNLAPNFYQFFIVDTVVQDNIKLVALSFYPRNNTDMLFQGRMYVTLDGSYAVAKVIMTVNKHINLNWVRDLDINLDFTKANNNKYYLSRSELKTDFGISQKQSGGIYGRRVLSLKGLVVNQEHPDEFYKGDAVVAAVSEKQQNEDYIRQHRHDSLSDAEARTYANMDSLTGSRSFKRAADIATLLLAGYKRVSPYFEIGPVNAFYSFNPVEGLRLRVGGRTTPNLSKHYMLETYAAYGFKDEKWKYYLGGTYSFTDRSIYEFPVRALRANYQKDTKIPGQELQFVQEDNFLLSFKRGVNDKWLYNEIYNLDYLHEMRNHLSFRAGYKNWTQEAAGGLSYVREDGSSSGLEDVHSITTSELSLELRWAPHEEFYQGKLYRTPLPNRYPVFTLRGIAGIKGFINGQYNYQNVTANIYKRVYLSQLGYSDVVLEGGNIFGKVPFPLLAIHRANQTYSMQLQSYNLMNFLEFVSDHYASLIIDHCFNGFIFNKLPLIKKTRLREYVNVKVLYGGVRDENLPQNNHELLRFPVYPDGTPATYTLESQPYVEGGVGVGNIFNFFRVDLVRRFTYLNHPNVSELGIRARFRFDF